MDVQKMLEILKRDYGIESKEELIERFESSKGINIGIFTERRQNCLLRQACLLPALQRCA